MTRPTTTEEDAILARAMQDAERNRQKEQEQRDMIDQISRDIKEDTGFDLDRFVNRPTIGENFARVLPYIILAFGLLVFVHFITFGVAQ